MSLPLDPDRLKSASKFMSLVLRHRPALIGLELQEGGWASVDALLEGMRRKGHSFTREDLEILVANNDKSRFAFDPSGTLIRANQGHSVEVDLQLLPSSPPDVLYHGTHAPMQAAILREGFKKMKRHHVHLSEAVETAKAVGARRGTPVILRVDAKAMAAAGILFYRSENGVWLVDEVRPRFLVSN